MSSIKVKCFECGEEGLQEEMVKRELYDTPWEERPRVVYLHSTVPEEVQKGLAVARYTSSCEELLTDHSWADFRYFVCEFCWRTICEQNPKRGEHIQYREMEVGQVCLKCYEAYILENGIPRDAFMGGKLPGMFFSLGNPEPLNAGYTIATMGALYPTPIDNVFVSGPKEAQRIADRAIELIDAGFQVVVGYEDMAIGGSEGYVTLFAKKDPNAMPAPIFEDELAKEE